ncbi:MAG: hypothetical protein AAF191_16830 [Verrucomicrobiota bacterium]
MGFFAGIDDELTRELTEDYGDVFRAIRELMVLLDVDSYGDMGDQGANVEQLLQSERELAKELRPKIQETLPEDPDRRVIRSFLAAYRMEPLVPDTVGPWEETVATLELKTLPLFRVRSVDPDAHDRTFRQLCERFQVLPVQIEEMDEEVRQAREQLDRRRLLVDALRARLVQEGGGPTDRETIREMFDRFFPDHPLRTEEIEMVLTRTCLYWALPTAETLVERTMEEREAAEAWLKNTGRFAFQYFSHFPTFSSFDARDACPSLLTELAEELCWSETEVIELLNSSTTIERVPEIEKYLVHDTWGHMWQGDLTGLRRLYDTLESLKSPVDANDHLTLPDGNVVTLLDLIYLTARGEIRYDEELADAYLDHWIRVRVEASLAPMVAELTADSVEYKYQLDHGDGAIELPSSSLFSSNPAKLDFAWVDIGYFVRSIIRTNRAYARNEEVKENLVDRICLLLKLKYPRQHRAIQSAADLREQVGAVVDQFLERLQERQDLHLNQDLASGDQDGDCVPDANAFFLLFTNFLRIQFALNQIIQGEIEEQRRELAPLLHVLLLFVTRHFEQGPLARFWDLDETLARYALPLLVMVDELEGER